MAFQSMLSGAECSTSNNTLSQFLKHTHTDRSLQQDGMQRPQPSGVGAQTFRSSTMMANPQEMEAFAQQNHAVSGVSGFDMRSMRAEMDSMRAGVTGPKMAPMVSGGNAAWAQEMQMQGPALASGPQQVDGIWSDQFHGQPHAQAPRVNAQSVPRPNMGPNAMGSMGMYGMPMGGMGMGMRSSYMQPQAAPDTARPQPKFVELDNAQWEEQFRKLEEGDQAHSKGKAKDTETPEEVINQERELREMQERLGDTFQDANPRFQELWDMLKDPSLHKNNDELAKWEEKLMEAVAEEDPTNFQHPGGGLGPGAMGLHEMDGLGETEAGLRKAFNEQDENGFPRLGDYSYASNNPFSEHATPFAAGLRLLEQNGSLTDAALLFEVATLRDQEIAKDAELERTNVEKSRAWQKLGECQAMNEHEEKAIQALEEALRLDSDNLQAHMSLAVSYINEGYDNAANATMLRYLARTHPHIARSPEFPALPDANTNPWSRLNYVRDLFLKAARENAASGQMDPDVQVGLGILFYSSSSYDQAKDCFETALHSRPEDFQLWNRLGATLANGGKPEMATEAYHRALELRPTFTRAIYNLSVSCLNLGAHHQAAEHLLSALTLQRTQSLPDTIDGTRARQAPPLSEAKESESLWSTLRSIFVVMGKPELAAQCQVGADMNQFRREGFEF
ncbi:Peroxisomal membrane signal receptor PTS1 [Malassezia vespertilionis]|uniref:Peroxisomal membrane signal receptor PTS1 n=1 Tax=Malassezia vespertilionis TaxID=2020962 RepID=UPI0024B1C423|nr:Peroxisomal membrane signal receptor PTS1 [Malassezia vespertilionis]WFD04722.1 Peroxisomal membrane signal receptor PTS1 [Malassezia vespertilionis]